MTVPAIRSSAYCLEGHVEETTSLGARPKGYSRCSLEIPGGAPIRSSFAQPPGGPTNGPRAGFGEASPCPTALGECPELAQLVIARPNGTHDICARADHHSGEGCGVGTLDDLELVTRTNVHEDQLRCGARGGGEGARGG